MRYRRKLVEYVEVESEGKCCGMKRSYANNVMQQAAGFWKTNDKSVFYKDSTLSGVP